MTPVRMRIHLFEQHSCSALPATDGSQVVTVTHHSPQASLSTLSQMSGRHVVYT